jgi:hypothetical protein
VERNRGHAVAEARHRAALFGLLAMDPGPTVDGICKPTWHDHHAPRSAICSATPPFARAELENDDSDLADASWA